MSQLIFKRLRLLAFLVITAGVIGGVAWSQLRDERHEIVVQSDKLIADGTKLTSNTAFGDFSTQSVDEYLVNLNNQLSGLYQQRKGYDLLLGNADLLPHLDFLDLAGKRGTINAEIERFELDRGFMAIASYDYRILGLHPDVRRRLAETVQMLASISFNLQQTFRDPTRKRPSEMYVYAGQVIGLQGCTGVCSGTHVHFVVGDNAVPRDPCLYLPKRESSRWGVDSDCGVASDPQMHWPVPIPWIVTDIFDNYSTVTGEYHSALDIIDREFAPVVAAHDGWYHFIERSCKFGIICNNGAAKIATVCVNKDCSKGIHTSYWHLAWMVNESPVAKLPQN